MKNIQFCCHLFCFRCFMPSIEQARIEGCAIQATWYGFLHSKRVTFWQRILFMPNIYAASQVASLLLMETIFLIASESMQSNEIQFRFCFSIFPREQLFGLFFFINAVLLLHIFGVLMLGFRWFASFYLLHRLKYEMLPVALTIEYDRCIVPNSSRPI